MGGAISRAVARRVSPRAAPASEEAVRQAVSPQELERQRQIKEALQRVQYEEGKNAQLVSDMSKLMAAVGTRQVQLYSSPQTDQLYSRRKKSKEEREAEQVGRLSTKDIKALFDDRIRAWQQGQELGAEELARRFGANAEVLQTVLQYNSVPAVQRAEDGRLVGRWPE